MPLLIALGFAAAVFVLTVAMLPFTIIFRYRQGTKRRRARPWVANINTFATALSATILIVAAAITNRWIENAFPYSVAGLACGCLLGFAGLALSRWEADGRSLFYTPNRLLVFAVSLVVTARLAYGFWRGWEAWRAVPDAKSSLAAIGVAGSMAAGAVVVGYYLVYWAGLRARLKRVRGSGYNPALRPR